MIPQIKNSSLSFQANNNPNSEITKLKKKGRKIFRATNNVTGTCGGFIKGLAKGTLAAGIIGVAGKSIQEANGDIGKSLVNSFKESGSAIINGIKAIPALLIKSPQQNLQAVAKAPVKFYKKYLSKNPITFALSAGSLIGITAFGTIRGKMKANKKNADIDHKWNLNHK